MMDWTGFFVGSITTMMIYAFYTMGKESEEDELEVEAAEGEVEVHGFQARHVTMSCQTCRKLKHHKEIEPNLYQCVKCK
ncbi:hypothetical protein E2329_23585, partial [Salmonella enterica subsp. enterica]|nr:hypothetical protein [Salmonella enterica subsp. enterica serovar Paratyphi A]